MTLTIDLTLQEEASLAAAAQQTGVAPEEVVKKLLAQLVPVPEVAEETLREEYRHLAMLDVRGQSDDAQRARLSRVKQELDDREERSPAVQALLRRLDEDDARLDRIIALLESRSRTGRAGGAP